MGKGVSKMAQKISTSVIDDPFLGKEAEVNLKKNLRVRQGPIEKKLLSPSGLGVCRTFSVS